MAVDPIIQAAEIFTSVMIVLSAMVFTRLAFKSKGFGSFQFQLSIFVIIWVIAELPHIAGTLGLIDDTSFATFGITFHFISMAAFAFFVGIRSIQFLHPHQTPPSNPANITTPSMSPTKQPGAPKN